MPVKKLRRSGPSPAAQALLNRLVDEWQHPDPNATQPIIVEENGGQGQPTHIYVIWDDWAPLGSIERSEVIMSAYEEVRGRAGAINVTVAMGLTPAEADRLGIRYP
ncbi:MAG TPA: hypothetical protein VK797_28790 [Tepidisphaeraceae bacterium]|nr:hypothetical protein [Tepidisphaeraceae bacterium]